MATKVLIARAGAGKIGAVGASEAACRDLGSIREAKLTIKGVTYKATQANRGSQVVKQSKGPTTYTLALILEEHQVENFIAMIDGQVDSDGLVSVNSQSTELAEWCGWFHGFEIDGEPCILHVLKASVVPDGEVKLGTSGDQSLISLTYELMADVDSVLVDGDDNPIDVLEFPPDVTDTTPPTITTRTPADAATAVDKAITTLVVWTFSEAIRSEDVNDLHFYVHDPNGDVKAGTLALGTNNTIVTFTPTTAWTLNTIYTTQVVKGVRDVAGNKLAANAGTIFTTGS